MITCDISRIDFTNIPCGEMRPTFEYIGTYQFAQFVAKRRIPRKLKKQKKKQQLEIIRQWLIGYYAG